MDEQGLLGEADGTSNVQELLDALAQKVALELVSNSKLTEILSGYIATSSINNTGLVTNEGFVADARQMNPNVSGSLAAKVKKNTDDIVTANSNLTGKTNTSDFNNLKNSIVMVNVTGFAIGIDGNNVIIQWLTGVNREFGYALNISTTDGTMQFFYRENGAWKPSWTK